MIKINLENKLVLWFGIWYLFNLNLSAQDLPVILPSTPDIMEFQKFGDVPVGQYTGIPNINIPIYEITTRSGLSVPISLSYHAGGIKVDEKASRTGLGWSLNAGGAISKQIKGVPDFGQIFPNTGTFNPVYTNNGVEDDDDYLFAMGVVEFDGYNTADAGYDIYNYRFLGRSGKFFWDNNGSPQHIPYKKLKIESIGTVDQTKITDEMGNSYFFDLPSTSQMQLGCPPSGPGNWVATQRNVDQLLSRIRTHTGEEIYFYYTNYSYNYIVSHSETDYSVSTTFGNYGCTYKPKETCVDTIYHVEPILKSIRFNDDTSEIKFIYSDDVNYPISGSNTRKDFPGNPALRKVEIWNDYSKVEDYELKYDYFVADGAGQNPDVDEQRLKLTELVHNGLESHTFEYEETLNLPARFSYSQDSWGYFNGIQNSSLLPEFNYGNEYFTGADRSVSTTHPKANTLTKINYPTGGYTQLFYENNSYYDSNGSVTYQNGSISFPSASQNFQSHAFSIQSNYGNVQVHFTDACDPQEDPNNPPQFGGSCEIEILDSNNQTVWYQFANGVYDAPFLTAGDYTLRYSYLGSSCNCDVAITYLESTTVPAGNVLSGGLRVSKITDNDGQQSMDTFYEYNTFGTTQSSGVVQGDPNFYSISETVKADYSTCKYLVRKSNSIFPLATSGSSVGYSNVTVFKKSKAEHGHVEHTFTNPGTAFPTGFYNTLISLEPIRTWERGLETKNAVFNAVGDTVQVVENGFQFNNYFVSQSSDYYNDNKMAAGYNIRLRKPEVWEGLTRHPATFEWDYYYLRSTWVNNIWTEKRFFNGSGVVTERLDYGYDTNSGQKNTIVKSSSDGTKEETFIYYPDNVVDVQSLGLPYLLSSQKATIDNLKTNDLHRVAEAVQTEKRVYDLNDNLITNSFQRTTFKDWDNGTGKLISPDTISTLKGSYNVNDNPLQNRIVFKDIALNGNPREVKKVDGAPIVYFWGYNDRYPIANIENTTYSQVSTYESNLKLLSNQDDDNCTGAGCAEQTLRDALENLRQSFPNALVTTYTYDPLVGVTSITDPMGNTTYYEYDNSNRLEFIRDRDGKLVEEYKYNYKNQ